MFFGQGARVYDLEDLLRPSAEVFGKGTFRMAYKAVLEMGTVAAVKRLKEVSTMEREFREKIAVIRVMEHQNLVGLRPYYYSKDERLQVYDYMQMGSLSSLLHDLDFLFHMFFLARYCKLLEENSFRGWTADFFYMLLFGATTLTGIVLLGGMIPFVSEKFAGIVFLSNSLTFMMVYVWSKHNPFIHMSFLVLFTFTATYLPWLLGFSL
ncbi:derlin-2.2-like [Asparagus officinalis]|uniref:derlin-2.2-like n=1 Tax=Asparagus officinalis TaxID=4686 RepID=UPI00098E7892|nr:derlin-2.2-like [Asparagus officinalis]